MCKINFEIFVPVDKVERNFEKRHYLHKLDNIYYDSKGNPITVYTKGAKHILDYNINLNGRTVPMQEIEDEFSRTTTIVSVADRKNCLLFSGSADSLEEMNDIGKSIKEFFKKSFSGAYINL